MKTVNELTLMSDLTRTIKENLEEIDCLLQEMGPSIASIERVAALVKETKDNLEEIECNQ